MRFCTVFLKKLLNFLRYDQHNSRPSMQSLPDDSDMMPPPVCQSSVIRNKSSSIRYNYDKQKKRKSSELEESNNNSTVTESSSFIPNSQGGSVQMRRKRGLGHLDESSIISSGQERSKRKRKDKK